MDVDGKLSRGDVDGRYGKCQLNTNVHVISSRGCNLDTDCMTPPIQVSPSLDGLVGGYVFGLSKSRSANLSNNSFFKPVDILFCI